jgi:hypothetical protein
MDVTVMTGAVVGVGMNACGTHIRRQMLSVVDQALCTHSIYMISPSHSMPALTERLFAYLSASLLISLHLPTLVYAYATTPVRSPPALNCCTIRLELE